MKITRRNFIAGIAATGALSKVGFGSRPGAPPIDRYALVSRHNPVLKRFEPLSPLSVGNGEFAFTCDVTGLQTFPDLYKDAMPLCTMSQWGWHTSPMPEHLKGKKFKPTEYDSYGRKVPYITGKTGQEELYDYLRENPHRLHLGRVGLKLTRTDGSEAKAADITDIEQKLDLWTGIISSRFNFEGEKVAVRTAVHPQMDALSVSIESELIRAGKLALRIAFPYGSSSMQAADWNSERKHITTIGMSRQTDLVLSRKLDDDEYIVGVRWGEPQRLTAEKQHQYLLLPTTGTQINVTVAFSRLASLTCPNVTKTFTASEQGWKDFWTVGAAIDLSESKDLRANELERRVVLSQYLTAIQCSGSLPPQETGLTCNSWYGKFHLEMHWWHAAHFALWSRFRLLEQSLHFYRDNLPGARKRARLQGYYGARWPKMTSPDGRDSPSPIGPLLIWQQPHPIFFAELRYLNDPTYRTLNRYQTIVEETADFMASYFHFDQKRGTFVLGPPVIPAQENHPPRETWNPTFELEYWHWGLNTAQKWRQRMGLRPEPKWRNILDRPSALPTKDGVYLAHENCPQTFTERNKDHPSMLAALGMLPGELVDRETMRRTLKKVMKEWDWPETWGWDYPMVAMTAARLGETSTAIDALLLNTPKNHYAANGHNYQRPNLPCYLPANGGLLYAVALMANGWKGAPNEPSPGFPQDGSWKVRSEGFNAAIFREI